MDLPGLPGWEDEGHRARSAAEEPDNAASGVWFGVTSGRISRLLDLERVKDYAPFGFG
jgi:hypothetical protein